MEYMGAHLLMPPFFYKVEVQRNARRVSGNENRYSSD